MHQTIHSPKPVRRRQKGVALIEALIGFLIFAIGVLGLIGLQASMSKAQTGAKVRADATLLANEVVGLMWADTQANLPNYVGAGCDGHPPCADWRRKVAAVLPKGTSTVEFDGGASQQVRVVLTWTLPEEGEHRFEMTGTVNRQ